MKRSSKNKRYFHGIELQEPSEDELKKYLDIWYKKYDTEFSEYSHELILNLIFKDYNHSNKVIKDMYIKCAILDKFYGTNIKHLDSLVKHLSEIENFNERIKNGDADLVNEMKRVTKTDGSIINYLSFASKYCHRYEPNKYPIYDSIVKDVLMYYNSIYGFCDKSIDLKDYNNYKKLVDKFIERFSFIKNYVVLDHYLWTMGKEKLKEIRLLKRSKK